MNDQCLVNNMMAKGDDLLAKYGNMMISNNFFTKYTGRILLKNFELFSAITNSPLMVFWTILVV